jgi:hypothetical protein
MEQLTGHQHFKMEGVFDMAHAQMEHFGLTWLLLSINLDSL